MKKIKQLLDLFDEQPRFKYGVIFIMFCAFAFGIYALITVNL